LGFLDAIEDRKEDEVKNIYTREEVIDLLESLYGEVAYLYDDYGRTDFSQAAIDFVKDFMENK
jgi:hypothetical protein